MNKFAYNTGYFCLLHLFGFPKTRLALPDAYYMSVMNVLWYVLVLMHLFAAIKMLQGQISPVEEALNINRSIYPSNFLL